jgi:predicted PurR-regulated permease PerM
LVAGSLWGFWGFFFAIPLATLVKAIIEGCVRHSKHNTPEAMADASMAEKTI